MATERKDQVSNSIERNIRSIARLEAASEESKSSVDRFASLVGTVAGSKLSIVLHTLWFTSWLLINTHCVPGIRPWDPRPFSLLGLCVSIEAVLLSIFVLLKQTHMQQRTDHRDQLNLQIDLLTEKELTKALQLLRLMCVRLNIEEVIGDQELAEMAQITSVGTLAERIMKDLPPQA